MAKRKPRTAKPAEQNGNPNVELTEADRRTLASLRSLADGVVSMAERSRPPHLDIPSRSLSNVRFNKSRRVIEMGSGTNRRELFNLSRRVPICKRCSSPAAANS